MIKTLIVRACAVGDFVLNLPALQALHKVQPHARFTLVGYPSTLELAREFIPVDGIYSIETAPWSRLFYEPISGWYFDSAVVWMRDAVFADNVRVSGVPNVMRADPFPQSGHASTHLLRTVKLAAPPLPDLWEPSSDEIILHPGSGSPKKNWPHFDQLALALREREANSQVKLGIPEGLTLVEVSYRLRPTVATLLHRTCRDHSPGRFPGRAYRRPFRSHRSPDLGTHGAAVQGHLEENS